MGLFRRSAAPEVAVAAAAPAGLVEVAVLERWRAEAAVEELRDEGIRATAADASGRRTSWAGECTAELSESEHHLPAVPTSRVLVATADAARARRILCERTDEA